MSTSSTKRKRNAPTSVGTKRRRFVPESEDNSDSESETTEPCDKELHCNDATTESNQFDLKSVIIMPKLELQIDAITLPTSLWDLFLQFKSLHHETNSLKENGLDIPIERLPDVQVSASDRDCIKRYHELELLLQWSIPNQLDESGLPLVTDMPPWTDQEKRKFLSEWITPFQFTKIFLLLAIRAFDANAAQGQLYQQFQKLFGSRNALLYEHHRSVVTYQQKQQELATFLESHESKLTDMNPFQRMRYETERETKEFELESWKASCLPHPDQSQHESVTTELCNWIWSLLTKPQCQRHIDQFADKLAAIKLARRDKLKMSTAHRSLHSLVPLLLPNEKLLYFGHERPSAWVRPSLLQLVSFKQTTVQVKVIPLVQHTTNYNYSHTYRLLEKGEKIQDNPNQKTKPIDFDKEFSVTAFTNIDARTGLEVENLDDHVWNSQKFLSIRVIRNQEHLRMSVIFLILYNSNNIQDIPDLDVADPKEKETNMVRLITMIKEKRIAKHDNRNALQAIASLISQYVSSVVIDHVIFNNSRYRRIDNLQQWLDNNH